MEEIRELISLSETLVKVTFSELVFPTSQMVNLNNQEPSSIAALSPFTMEARMDKLEAQVVELSHKMDTQFQSTQEFLERFKVRMQAEFSSLKHELMEALGLNESPPLVPDEELGNPAGDSEAVKMNLGVEDDLRYLHSRLSWGWTKKQD
nr:histone acetyltransferase HAC1-like isoform X1 [Ipomoea batatas]